jgi:uncharacterized protein
MRIGIISDTHDNLESIERAFLLFEAENIDLVVHCGDWNRPQTLEYLSNTAERAGLPVMGIFGNNDKKVTELLIQNRHLSHPIQFAESRILEFEAGNKRFAAYHGDNKKLLNNLIESKEYDVVLTGHTHMAKKDFRHGKLIINPGSTSFQIPRVKGSGLTSIAVYDTRTTQAQIIYLN